MTFQYSSLYLFVGFTLVVAAKSTHTYHQFHTYTHPIHLMHKHDQRVYYTKRIDFTKWQQFFLVLFACSQTHESRVETLSMAFCLISIFLWICVSLWVSVCLCVCVCVENTIIHCLIECERLKQNKKRLLVLLFSCFFLSFCLCVAKNFGIFWHLA